MPKEGAQPTKLASQFAQPFSIQFVELMKRCMREYWRNPGVRRGAGGGEDVEQDRKGWEDVVGWDKREWGKRVGRDWRQGRLQGGGRAGAADTSG